MPLLLFATSWLLPYLTYRFASAPEIGADGLRLKWHSSPWPRRTLPSRVILDRFFTLKVGYFAIYQRVLFSKKDRPVFECLISNFESARDFGEKVARFYGIPFIEKFDGDSWERANFSKDAQHPQAS